MKTSTSMMIAALALLAGAGARGQESAAAGEEREGAVAEQRLAAAPAADTREAPEAPEALAAETVEDAALEAAAAAPGAAEAPAATEAVDASVAVPAPAEAVSGSEVLLAETSPGAPPEALAVNANETKQVYDLIGDGTRVDLKDKQISITAPVGWEVFTKHPNLTLLMQVPYSKDLRYQRTIQVASFAGPRYMDQVTAKEFEEKIVRNFSQVSAAVEGFRVRNNMPIEMADGRKGLLFYTEYKMYGMELMQAHILVSSPSRHFLMTFTDVAEHFEKDDDRQFLTEAWDAMTSVKLAGRQPGRFEPIAMMGIGLGVLFVFALTFWAFRNWRSGKQYGEYTSGRGLEDVDMSGADTPLSSGAQPLSRLDDDDEPIMTKATARKPAPAPSRAPTPNQAPNQPPSRAPRAKAPVPPPPTVSIPATGNKASPASQLPTTSRQPETGLDDGDTFFDNEDDVAS